MPIGCVRNEREFAPPTYVIVIDRGSTDNQASIFDDGLGIEVGIAQSCNTSK